MYEYEVVCSSASEGIDEKGRKRVCEYISLKKTNVSHNRNEILVVTFRTHRQFPNKNRNGSLSGFYYFQRISLDELETSRFMTITYYGRISFYLRVHITVFEISVQHVRVQMYMHTNIYMCVCVCDIKEHDILKKRRKKGTERKIGGETSQ